MLTKKLTFILYDGITNSIFVSQVLQPILNLLKENNNIEITLVSFEKKKPSNKKIMEIIPAHHRLHFVLARRIPFYGKISLKLGICQLKKLFKIIKTDKIIARGALAGWITIQTINQIFKNKNEKNKHKISNKLQVIIQARGLSAEEYRFSTQNNKENFIIKKIKNLIYKKLNKIEKETYKRESKPLFNKTIEAVSPALKEYLTTNFKATRANISIAKKDIPKKIHEKEIQKWRKIIRNKLHIKEDQTVYCYSGSYKPWQCIPQIVKYFCKQYNKNSKSFLLILSPDKKELTQLLKKENISKKNYKILYVKPEEIYKYMSASDIGLLFRDKDIINWVSRPTKMLEYQAAGLKIIHNRTIAWLES